MGVAHARAAEVSMRWVRAPLRVRVRLLTSAATSRSWGIR
jgi:hypothetical protein